MATLDFMDDVSVAFRKYIQGHGVKRPSVLKVTYEDALFWHGAAHTAESTPEFVERNVKPYVQTLPLNRHRLEDCRVVLVGVDSGEVTRFE